MNGHEPAKELTWEDVRKTTNCRILVIDDAPAIHNDFRKILCREESHDLNAASAALFDDVSTSIQKTAFHLDSAYQGQEGLAKVEEAKATGKPYAMAFVDVRMPPGWDGIETISRIWAVDPDLQVVICTAYSDYSWEEMITRLGQTDSLLLLKKPFDNIEVLQLAHALTRKWALLQQSRWRVAELDERVNRRTEQLRTTNEKLLSEIVERKHAELRLEAFSALGHRLSAAQTIVQAGEIIVDAADQLIGWSSCLLELYYPADDTLQHVLGRDMVGDKRVDFSERPLRRTPTPLSRRALREGAFLILKDDDTQMYEGSVAFGNTSRPSSSLMFVPIRNGSTVLGIFSIQSYKQNAYTQETLQTLQALADHCGGALHRIQTQESLQATQQQLRQAQKMEAIGQLAGGVAHDFNNLLAVIRGNAELATMACQRKSAPDLLSQIIAAADRAANLTKQLLAFSRKQILQSNPLSLNEVIANLTKMLTRIIGEHIELQCAYAADLPLIKADSTMIEQILVNLIVNSRDAMPNGGRINIATEFRKIDSTAAQTCQDAKPGNYVCLTVSDSGMGIPPEHLARIFEPFFTTKQLGKGTGLGLATVYGIVRQHQGWIEVDSRQGKGTTFAIYFPALEKKESVRQTRAPQPIPAGGTETILLVEDEGPVRFVTKRLLESHGYTVREAASGVQALKLWRDCAESIDLVLTDILMPEGVSGREMAEELVSKKPSLKVIYMSGYGGEVTGNSPDFLASTHAKFLQKPCSGRDLLHAIRDSLDEGANTNTNETSGKIPLSPEPAPAPASPSAQDS